MPVINVRGKPAGKSTGSARKTMAKPARRTAAKSTTAPKRRTTAKAKTNGRQSAERVNRSSKMPDLPKSQINGILNPLAKSAKAREKHYEDWKSEVANVNELIVSALDAEIPVKDIVEHANVSRQHVYKIIADLDAGKRSANGVAKGVAGRPPAKKVTRSAGSKRITRSANGRKASAAKPTARKRIRAKS
jgi:hypothetical protein